jgi:hypothetical protein
MPATAHSLQRLASPPPLLGHSPTPIAKIFVIEVPPKLWRAKPDDRYILLDYSDDLDDTVFLFEKYG